MKDLQKQIQTTVSDNLIKMIITSPAEMEIQNILSEFLDYIKPYPQMDESLDDYLKRFYSQFFTEDGVDSYFHYLQECEDQNLYPKWDETIRQMELIYDAMGSPLKS